LVTIEDVGSKPTGDSALFVDVKALNNEASAHAYNPLGREKEVHKKT
jgi:hypothetical protein